MTSLHPHTLRKYADEGRIRSYKTSGGQRRLHLGDLQQVANATRTGGELPAAKPKPTRGARKQNLPRVNYIYVRISPQSQSQSGSTLQDQVDAVIRQNDAYADYVVVSDVATGTQFRNKGLFTLLDACVRGTIGEVVVAHRDRLGRVALDLLQHLIQKAGGKVVALDLEAYRSSATELSEDMFMFMQKHVYPGNGGAGKKPSSAEVASVPSTTVAPALTTTDAPQGEGVVPALVKRPRGRPPGKQSNPGSQSSAADLRDTTTA
jgi:predicted site-specific integrase-resolvase